MNGYKYKWIDKWMNEYIKNVIYELMNTEIAFFL